MERRRRRGLLYPVLTAAAAGGLAGLPFGVPLPIGVIAGALIAAALTAWRPAWSVRLGRSFGVTAIATAAVIANGVAGPALERVVGDSAASSWLIDGPGQGVLGLLPGVIVVVLLGRRLFGHGLRDQWGGSLRFPRAALIHGVVAGALLATAAVAFLLLTGLGRWGPNVDVARMGVNAFSNLWEELLARGLLLVVVREAFGDRTAMIWTSVFFGVLLHGLSPFALFIAATSWILAWAVIRARSLWAGWVGHQVADVIADSLVVAR